MSYTDDPVADWDRHCDEEEDALARLPKCSVCGWPIQQEEAVNYEGEWVCEDCEAEFWDVLRKQFLERTSQ